jgi:CRP-like cAMP-binding protein
MSQQQHIREIFQSLELFEGVNPELVQKIADSAEIVTFADDQIIFEEGADSNDLAYVLVEGVVTVSIQGMEVALLGPGTIIGEYALIQEATRSATVKPIEGEAICAAINSENLFALLDESAAFAELIMERLKQNFKRGIGMFSPDEE